MKFSFVENHSTSFLKVIKVCAAADGQDGSGLQLETSSLGFWKKTVKLITVFSSNNIEKINQSLPIDALRAFCFEPKT